MSGEKHSRQSSVRTRRGEQEMKTDKRKREKQKGRKRLGPMSNRKQKEI